MRKHGLLQVSQNMGYGSADFAWWNKAKTVPLNKNKAN